MRALTIHPADPANPGSVPGTVNLLKLLLTMRCHGPKTFLGQQRMRPLILKLDNAQGDRVFLTDSEHAWLMDELRGADYTGLVAGKLLGEVENAEEVKDETVKLAETPAAAEAEG